MLHLYFDEDAMQAILVTILQERGFDCLTVRDAGLRGRSAIRCRRSGSL